MQSSRQQAEVGSKAGRPTTYPILGNQCQRAAETLRLIFDLLSEQHWGLSPLKA